MAALIECVPNFSVGRDRATIDALINAVEGVSAVRLLHVDVGEAANRTVFTFVGPPEAVEEAAFRAIRCAIARIDMRHHQGTHPRIGAADVCPFVPLEGATMETCVAIAQRLGARVGEVLGAPVYLYGAAASRPDRVDLAVVRAGQYEGLVERWKTADGAPDFGPTAGVGPLRSGAVAIGARPLLIAFNVNLNTRNVRKAARIAALVRERGRKRKLPDGRTQQEAGLLQAVKAIGWYIDEYRCCQVSLNLVNHAITPPHVVYDVIRNLAEREGVMVTGAELVGLIPLSALRAAGQHYLRRQGSSPGAPDSELIEVAAQSMGLRSVKAFEPDLHILERRLSTDGPLVSGSVRSLVDRVSAATPTPGGGVIAALCGALSASLSSMVAGLVVGRPGYETQRELLEAMTIEAQELKAAYLEEVDGDAQAFAAYLAARRMPRKTMDQRARRQQALQVTGRQIIDVPLEGMKRALRLLDCVALAAKVNEEARSDAGVAALTAWVAAEGSWYNISLNLKLLDDEEMKETYQPEADRLLEQITDRVFSLQESIRRDLWR